MSSDKDIIYIKHIRDAIFDIETYLKGKSLEDLKSDSMLLDAVVRKLEIIGEATNKLSESFKRKHPQILYRDIIDMRNFLVHEYFGVNPKIVWDTCKFDLPTLKNHILNVLN